MISAYASSFRPCEAAIGSTRWVAIACGSTYRRMPSTPCRRPRPDERMPPIGVSIEPKVAA